MLTKVTMSMVARQVEVRRKINEAFSRGRYFITVTKVDEKRETLDHYFAYENFKEKDLLLTLRHFASEMGQKELKLPCPQVEKGI